MALLAISLTASCSNAATLANRTTVSPDGPALPIDAAILDGAAVPTLLHQCSRSTPAAGEDTWQPTPADIAALEAALPAALAERPHPETANAPQGWLRQYAGIVRGGRRFIYGNFVPLRPEMEDLHTPEARWRTEADVICDGGPAFFGVEYDVAARHFTHVAFNGAI